MGEAYTNEYSEIRAAASASMRDTCQIGSASATTDNDPANVTWTYATAIACGLKVTTKSEVIENGSQATVTHAELRLPWGTSVGTGNRVKMITQAGATLSPSPVYAVIGEPYHHIGNVRVNLTLLTGNSIL
jgi:hypothetical protein